MDQVLFLLEQKPLLLFLVLGFIGACVGSFLNVVIYRLPVMIQHEWKSQCCELMGTTMTDDPPDNLILPRSRCPDCLTPLKSFHNIPIIGYLMLRGKCAFCHKPISRRYPLIEILTAVLTAYLSSAFGLEWPLLFALIFTWTLIALCFIDLDHQLLPDNLTLPLLWLGILANYFGFFTSLENAVIGAMAGYLSLWMIYQVHFLLTKKQGMGHGDFKLLGAIGAWFGWQFLPLVVLIASVLGTLVGLFIIMKYKDRRVPIAFGPYLAGAGMVILIWGDALMNNYLGLF